MVTSEYFKVKNGAVVVAIKYVNYSISQKEHDYVSKTFFINGNKPSDNDRLISIDLNEFLDFCNEYQLLTASDNENTPKHATY